VPDPVITSSGAWYRVGAGSLIALLTVPVAIAGHFTSTLRGMMVASAILSVAFTTSGLAVSYGPDLPAGATTIALAGLVYLVVLAVHWLRGR
jgi:zinc transport system permease protein